MSRFLSLLLVLLGVAAAAPAQAASRDADLAGVVNLNTASDGELQELPGIGPAKAQRIVEARTKHKFDTTDQLMKVKGIGRKTYRKLKPFLSVSGPTTLAHKVKAAKDAGDGDDGKVVVVPAGG